MGKPQRPAAAKIRADVIGSDSDSPFSISRPLSKTTLTLAQRKREETTRLDKGAKTGKEPADRIKGVTPSKSRPQVPLPGHSSSSSSSSAGPARQSASAGDVRLSETKNGGPRT